MSRIVADQARIRVPATSANLGPGFDALGIALNLFDDLYLQATTGKTEVEVSGVGAATLPTDDSHRVVRALRLGLETAGAPQVGVHLRCRNQIPHSRGLGSSAAAAVAGLLLARCLIAPPEALDDDTILNLATELEGHPDNAAPALLGGATVAWVQAGRARAAQLNTSADLVVTTLVPGESLPTTKARSALPDAVSHQAAAFNAGRSALLVLALESRGDLLLDATEDRLHQDYRQGVMPHTLQTIEWLRAGQYPAVVSGAGPAITVFSELAEPVRDQVMADGWQIHTWGMSPQGAHIAPIDSF